MMLNRRQFLLLTSGLVSGCQVTDNGGKSVVGAGRRINAGAVGDYAKDGVYSNYRDYGFFVIRRGDQLFALSAVCTHRNCKLSVASDSSFYCKCHGSTFDAIGHVTQGPARRDLPTLSSYTNELNELVVNAL